MFGLCLPGTGGLFLRRMFMPAGHPTHVHALHVGHVVPLASLLSFHRPFFIRTGVTHFVSRHLVHVVLS